MNLVYEFGSVSNIPLYNCSGVSQIGQRRPIIGTISVIYGLVSIALFIPCLKIIGSPELFRLSCYQIMFYVGIIDVGAICMCSILTGWLAHQGAVFCTYPTLSYYAGSYGLSVWLCSCLANIFLLINRILNFKNPLLAEKVFGGPKTFLLMLIPVFYGLYSAVFTKTICFNSIYYAWFFDPFIFPGRGLEYSNNLHSFNNLAVVIFTCLLYIYVGYMVITEWNKAKIQSYTKKFYSNSIMYQSLVICALDQFSSLIYVAMNYIPLPPVTTIIAQYFWQSAHAFPVFTYLTMNATIRRRFFGLFGKRHREISIAITSQSRRTVL